MKHGYLIYSGESLNMDMILILHVPPLPTLHTLDCQAFSLQEAKLQSVTSGRNSLGAGFILELPFFLGGRGGRESENEDVLLEILLLQMSRPVPFLFLEYHEKKRSQSISTMEVFTSARD